MTEWFAILACEWLLVKVQSFNVIECSDASTGSAAYSLTDSLTHTRTHALTDSLTHSLTHLSPLTHSCLCMVTGLHIHMP